MIYDIPKPIISPNFTIDDIHKIREWNYERRKDSTLEERLADINEGADKTLRAIEEIRRAKGKAVND
ncbi:MAG: hypothetical protein LBQ58_06340 [Synergistaceae bacterium]|jgi:hypothetical protein|nr:hypothetical protein [Synergistaceae bacterium]